MPHVASLVDHPRSRPCSSRSGTDVRSRNGVPMSHAFGLDTFGAVTNGKDDHLVSNAQAIRNVVKQGASPGVGVDFLGSGSIAPVTPRCRPETWCSESPLRRTSRIGLGSTAAVPARTSPSGSVRATPLGRPRETLRGGGRSLRRGFSRGVGPMLRPGLSTGASRAPKTGFCQSPSLTGGLVLGPDVWLSGSLAGRFNPAGTRAFHGRKEISRARPWYG